MVKREEHKINNQVRKSADSFQIKFCGFTREEDVQAAIDAGVDAIGLNFYPKSPRYVTNVLAEQLVRAIDKRALVVGVFVNEAWETIEKLRSSLSLDAIQLHGSEQSCVVPFSTPVTAIIKAMPWRSDSAQDIAMATDWSTNTVGSTLKGFLIDAYDPVQHGGTGRTARWDLLHPRPIPLQTMRLILAGGLTPQNVVEAIAIAKPDAVDTASGIEVSPGVKSAKRMQEFVAAVRNAKVDGRAWLAEPV
jgi:phosphoribosylanthranilate isomerase